MTPAGLTSGIVDSFIKASPDVLFLAFGRRAILTSATMWQALLYPPIYVRLLDMCVGALFGWKTQNITLHQKLAAYPHLYSFTSTKSVVHWFQIIRNGTFQMYDDDLVAPFSISDAGRYYKVAKFPTRNIKTPIVLLYGGSDSLVDIDVMLKELPKHVVAKEVPHYEHLDFLWAADVETEVLPHVFAALDTYANTDSNTPRPAQLFQPFTKRLEGNPQFSEDEDTSSSAPVKHSESFGIRDSSLNRRDTVGSFKSRSTKVSTRKSSGSAAPSASQNTERTTTSRPEGWWSSDDVAGTEPSTPASKTPTARRSVENLTKLFAIASPDAAAMPPAREDSPPPPAETANKTIRRVGSRSSIEQFGERGIRIGASKAVGGVSRDVGNRIVSLERGTSSASGSEEKKSSKRRRKEAA